MTTQNDPMRAEPDGIAIMGTKGAITEDTADKISESVGLDVEWVKQDMATTKIVQALKANLTLANALNIHGTPAFIIGNRIVADVPLDLDTLKNIIAATRSY